MIEVKIDEADLSRLAAAVTRIERELPGEAQAAMLEAANVVASEARRRAPRASGRMVRSIKAEATAVRVLNHASARVEVSARRVSRKYPSGYNYPRRIEFAHRPFLRPALAAKVRQVTAVLERRVVTEGIVNKWGGGT